MSSPAVERFFDLIQGGKRLAEAADEACLTDEELELWVLRFAEFCDSERFTTSHYDAVIARRLRKLEESLAKRDERLTHEFGNLAKTILELVKTVNRLVDAQRGLKVSADTAGKVVRFPVPPAAS
jgi:hypothetical protein